MEILSSTTPVQSDLSGLVREAGRGRVPLFRNASKLGLYPSTNAAIEAAGGRFIHILHDDDWVADGFYRKMREAIEAFPDARHRLCHYEVFYELPGPTWSPTPFRARRRVSGVGPEFSDAARDRMSLNLPGGRLRARETFERVGLFRTDLPMMADWEWPFLVRSATPPRFDIGKVAEDLRVLP